MGYITSKGYDTYDEDTLTRWKAGRVMGQVRCWRKTLRSHP